MSTFAGSYIREPADLLIAMTEQELIGGGSDPGAPSPNVNAQRWADLVDPQKADAISLLNEIILTAEDDLNAYARAGGYAIPLSPIDPIALQIVAQLCYITLLQRRRKLKTQDAEERRKVIRDGRLMDIRKGNLRLTSAVNTAVIPQDVGVYSSSADEREFTHDTLEAL